jgi:uncharacterized paraquat-inducible protein A
MSKAAALTLGAAFTLLPANLLPAMHISTAGSIPADMTNFAGVKALRESGLGYLAAIVFAASIVVQLVKIAGLAALLLAACGRLPRTGGFGAWILLLIAQHVMQLPALAARFFINGNHLLH